MLEFQIYSKAVKYSSQIHKVCGKELSEDLSWALLCSALVVSPPRGCQLGGEVLLCGLFLVCFFSNDLKPIKINETPQASLNFGLGQ